jgi:hypothetical protein
MKNKTLIFNEKLKNNNKMNIIKNNYGKKKIKDLIGQIIYIKS